MRSVALVALTLLTLSASEAPACALWQPPSARLGGNFDAIVIAAVTSAGYTDERRPDYRPWRAAASLRRVRQGTVDATVFEFGRTGSTAACDDGQSPPAPGDEWVLYLVMHEGRLQVRESYPLGIAREIDGRFREAGPTHSAKRGPWVWIAIGLALGALLGAFVMSRRRNR